MPPEPSDVDRIVQSVQDRIAAGNLKPGDWLPPIRDMATDYGVGATTVKGALKILHTLGAVASHQGRGTWIAGARPTGPPPHVEL